MPKIISRTTYSAPERQEKRREEKLIVYYCLCGEFALVIDKPLNRLARRPMDDSFVVDNARRKYKLNESLQKKAVLVDRSDAYEKQWRLTCPRCALLIGYEVGQPRGKYTYLLDGLTREQRRVGR